MFHLKYYLFCIFLSFNISYKNQETYSEDALTSETFKDKYTVQYNSADVVSNAYLDSKGQMWFTTSYEGVYIYDGEKFINYTTKDGLCGNEVSDILELPNGNILLGTENGICRFDGDNFMGTPIPKTEIKSEWLNSVYPTVNPNGVLTLEMDNIGNLWIGSNGAGAYKFDYNTFEPHLQNHGHLMPDSLHHNVVSSIIRDDQGHLWFTSFSHGGISEFDGRKFRHHALKDEYGDGMVSTAYKDNSGNLWFGTRNTGVHMYDGNQFINIHDKQTQKQVMMASVLVDSKEQIWLASFARDGVYIYKDQTLEPFAISGSENLIDIKCIAEDDEGNIWFGGRYGILFRYNGTELTDFTYLKKVN